MDHLERVSTFQEFVQIFSQFGNEMVEFAHLTGDRQNVSDPGTCAPLSSEPVDVLASSAGNKKRRADACEGGKADLET